MTKKTNTRKPMKIPDKIFNQSLRIYINKCVPFQYHGAQCRFLLSHALFSSFDIDDGTVLLMKTIAQKINFEFIKNVKDIGSGVGVMGISLKKKYPDVNMTFTDRDALALDFTKENCLQNKITDFEMIKELGVEDTGKKFDLIISNIPAKIGDKAFFDLVKRVMVSLNDNGLCAFVIITSFAEIIKSAITANNGIIIYEEATSRHTVYHFKPAEYGLTCDTDGFDSYRRLTADFTHAGFSYKMNSVFNLPDFDVMGYQSQLALNSAKTLDIKGTVVFWNPVHGHLPVNIAGFYKNMIEKIIVASRDLLQLRITRENLIQNGYDGRKLQEFHTSFISGIEATADFVFILPDITPFTQWETDLLDDLYERMSNNGYAIISAEKPDINRIADACNKFRIVKREKMKAFACIIMQKK